MASASPAFAMRVSSAHLPHGKPLTRGEGFSTTGTLARLAMRTASTTVAIGTSSWSSRMPAEAMRFCWVRMAAGFNSPLAPAATMMVFSAAWSTAMRAVPVNAFRVMETPVVSMPSARSRWQ